MTELEPTDTSVVQIRIGNRTYPAIRNTRCGVCMHPARFVIESRILQNYSRPSIVRWISDHDARKDDGSIEHWPALTTLQLKHHMESGHCPMDAEMVNELAKRRAEQLGFDLEKGTGQFVDHVIATKVVLSRGFERIIKGEAEPDVKDVLTASKILSDMERYAQAQIGQEQYQELFNVYFKTVRENVDPDTWNVIINKVANHPVVIEYRQKQELEGKTE